MFDEIPKVEFTVQENGVTVYRDSITFESMAELRNTSTTERNALFQARYDAWKATVEQMTAESNEQETEAEVADGNQNS